MSERILEENKNYQFYILTGAYTSKMEKIDFKSYGIFYCPYESEIRKKIFSELDGFEQMFEEEERMLKYLNLTSVSILIYSEYEEKILHTIDFLQMIQASHLVKLYDFTGRYTEYEDYPIKGEYFKGHQHSGFGRWFDHFEIEEMLFNDTDGINLFYLSEKDIIFVNQLLKIYLTEKHPHDFEQLKRIYLQAFHERKKYVKFILLTMIIESLNTSGENQAITYKISRMCAILVGANKDESRLIFQRMKTVYSVRSNYLHNAKYTLHEGNYLRYIHSLVSEILITTISTKFKIPVNKYFNLTTEMGFGERSFLIEDELLKTFDHLLKNEMNLILGVSKDKNSNKAIKNKKT
ncbi:MAG: hypothetical protein ABJB05_11430 [Parafilimonas sp.]